MRTFTALTMLVLPTVLVPAQPSELVHDTLDGGVTNQVANPAVPGSGSVVANPGSSLSFTQARMCSAKATTTIVSSARAATTHVDTGGTTNLGASDRPVGRWSDLTAGVQNHPTGANQFLGISPGSTGPATDPGVVNFSPNAAGGGAGAALAPTDMLYDFGASPLQTFMSGITSIFFVPQAGNEQWAGI